jgi:branched-chain amino acid transport system ATP-binding protein
LTVSDLAVSYGGVVLALRSASVEVADGAIVAVLGSNGAGKSTLLRAISGTLPLHHGRVDRGSVTLDGVEITRTPPSRIVRQGIVQVPEGRRIFTHLTVEENLRAGGISNRDRGSRERAMRRVMEMFEVLGERRRQRAGLLSGGEQQMLAIGRALMTEPRVLLLDEPSLGLAPLMVIRIRETIKEINAGGVAVLLIEQNAAMALAVASHAYVLEVGRTSLDGSAEELARTDRVRQLYLGAVDQDEVHAARRPRAPLARWTA